MANYCSNGQLLHLTDHMSHSSFIVETCARSKYQNGDIPSGTRYITCCVARSCSLWYLWLWYLIMKLFTLCNQVLHLIDIVQWSLHYWQTQYSSHWGESDHPLSARLGKIVITTIVVSGNEAVYVQWSSSVSYRYYSILFICCKATHHACHWSMSDLLMCTMLL